MYYKTQQTCLLLSIILLMVTGSEWAIHLGPIPKFILGMSFLATAMVGMIVHFNAEIKRIKKGMWDESNSDS